MATCNFPNDYNMQCATVAGGAGCNNTTSSPDVDFPWISMLKFDPSSLSIEEWEAALAVKPMIVQKCTNHAFVWNGLDLLEFLQGVQQADPGKAALKLMEALFTDEEMSSSCFKSGIRRSKPALDGNRVKLIEGSLLQYYGDKYSSIKKDVTDRCNQKCRDRARDKNKLRRSSAKKQQLEALERMSTMESKLDSLLDGQLQLMQAVFGLPFPATHCGVPITGLPDDILDSNVPSWNLDTLQN